MPARQRDHFVVVYHGESELKRVTGFRQPDPAYVLLLDSKGEIRLVSCGPVTAGFQGLTDRVSSILRSE